MAYFLTGAPTMPRLGELSAEIQVRTLAQHMWAETSNVLQYKREETVPKAVRRALYRGSAILETLDLEFDRVLEERDAYRTEIDVTSSAEELNVDSLEKTLDAKLPKQNRIGSEPYAALLAELRSLGVTTASQLHELLAKHMDELIKNEKTQVDGARASLASAGAKHLKHVAADRVMSGMFFTHSGFMRVAMGLEFGSEKARSVMAQVRAASPA